MMIHKEITIDGFTYSTDKARLNIPYIHEFLSERSYWAKGVPMDIVKRSIENSVCIGIYAQQKQVGFARVLTDLATFGYLADVFIDEAYRGRQLSKRLMEFIFSFDEIKVLRRFMLGTRDAHTLYAQYGFKAINSPERFMEVHQPDIYKKLN